MQSESHGRLPRRAGATGAVGPARAAARRAAAGVLGATALTLSACQVAEPLPLSSEVSQREVRILVKADDPIQMIVGEMYVQTLLEEHRSANLVQFEKGSPGDRMEMFASGSADIMVGCTGNLLNLFDPNAARAISAAYTSGDYPDRDFLAETHIALMNSLPHNLATVEPSSAPACENHHNVELPQNILFVYIEDLLNREERKALASLTKFLTTDEIMQVQAKAEELGSTQRAVELWINSQDAGGINTKAGDSDSHDNSEGSDGTAGAGKQDSVGIGGIGSGGAEESGVRGADTTVDADNVAGAGEGNAESRVKDAPAN